ncbi:hypothetical protein ACSBR1_025556 [Camellia fascicularis]
MGNNFLSMAILFLTFFIFSSCFQRANGNTSPFVSQNTRETLEIIISGGSYPPYSSPPPKSECPPSASPSPSRMPSSTITITRLPALFLPSSRIRMPSPSPSPSRMPSSTITITRLKKTITYDPQGITKTWKGKNVCAYKGYRCDKIPTDNTLRLSGVNFNGFNFNGSRLTTAGFLDQLPDLAYFHLTFLDLRFNFITGPVNPRVFNLNLDALFLNNNQFTGEIPDNLGNTSALYLTLANNKFIGPIPKSIGHAKINLLEVLLLNNKLSGCLPYEIGLLKIATVFDASMNQLTGPIPLSFGCLEKIQLLSLSFNKLYGTVPEELCQLDDLSNLTLSYNYFTQVGPECRELIKRNVLDVRMNYILDLPFQKSKAECAAFFSMERSCPDEKSMNYLPCDIEDFASRRAPSDEEILMPPVPAPSPSYAALERYRKMDLP